MSKEHEPYWVQMETPEVGNGFVVLDLSEIDAYQSMRRNGVVVAVRAGYKQNGGFNWEGEAAHNFLAHMERFLGERIRWRDEIAKKSQGSQQIIIPESVFPNSDQGMFF